MVLKEMVDEFMLNQYKDGMVTLYINSRAREYTRGSIDSNKNFGEEMLDTLELGIGMGCDFVAAILPNPLQDSHDLIDQIDKLSTETDPDEDILLTIPAFGSIEKTGGATIIVVFSTLFSGALIMVYDKLKKMVNSAMISSESGIQITH
jgi:hypothetical protein